MRLGADTQELDAGFFNCLSDLKVLYKRTLAQSCDYVSDHCRSSA